MLTLVMQYSRKPFAGTDFTFQVSVMATVEWFAVSDQLESWGCTRILPVIYAMICNGFKFFCFMVYVHGWKKFIKNRFMRVC